MKVHQTILFCSAGGKVRGGLTAGNQGPGHLSNPAQSDYAQSGLFQLQGDVSAGVTESLANPVAGTFGGDRSDGDVVSVAGTQDTQRSSQQTGGDAGADAGSNNSASMAATATANGLTASLAEQAGVTELVQGAPNEALNPVRAGAGSVTEVLTPEQNAALLKVMAMCLRVTRSSVHRATLHNLCLLVDDLPIAPEDVHWLTLLYILSSRNAYNALNASFALLQGAAERRARLEAQILAKAGRVDEGRAELTGGISGQKARLWARWFDPTTMELPADVCAPFQKAGVG